jgi:hypothetical protein
MHKFKRKKMAKTHRRANRTRRGGTKTASNATTNATTNAAKPDFQAILARVKELGAQAQTPIKPSKPHGISKSQKSEKRFKDSLAGKMSHSTTKSASKHGSHNRPLPE